MPGRASHPGSRLLTGLIAIPHGPIQWVKVRNVATGDDNDWHFAYFGIPDSRLNSSLAHLQIDSVKEGGGVGLSWSIPGEKVAIDWGEGGISAFPGFWTISVHVVIGETRWYLATPAANYGFQIATRAQWELYQAEARDLLKRPIPLATTTIVGTIFSAFRDLAVDARVSEQDPDGTIEIDEGQIRRVRFHYSGGPS